MDRDHIAWSRNHFDMLAEGGTWGVPRSGLIYTKRGGCLRLTAVMPYDPAMSITEKQLKEQQRKEIAGIQLHFIAAGIPVIDETDETS